MKTNQQTKQQYPERQPGGFVRISLYRPTLEPTELVVSFAVSFLLFRVVSFVVSLVVSFVVLTASTSYIRVRFVMTFIL